jgi:hypothetical protein
VVVNLIKYISLYLKAFGIEKLEVLCIKVVLFNDLKPNKEDDNL